MPLSKQQRKSRRQERRTADRFGGRTTSQSGAGWTTKNDVKTDDLSFEVKYTDKGSYSLKFADLKKAETNALMDSGREFAFLVGFGTTTAGNSLKIEREYVVISREYFESLRNH